MNVISIADVSCQAFVQAPENLDPSVLHRFVVGEDRGPTPVGPAGLAELGDPFATLLLQKGVFPPNADQLLAAIDAATPENDPLRTEMTFLLGEGSQLPGTGDEGPNRRLRFIVSRGRAPEGIDLLLSAADPANGLVELMAWDPTAGGFNYYRTVGRGPAWALAGNSRHALTEPTRGKGPFESHPSGSLIMKELKFPWLHWNSFKAQIPANAFPGGDPRVEHRWFKNLQGADVMEESVAKPSIMRWTEARFAQLATGDGGFADPRRVLEQIVTSPTANLVTSSSESAAVKADDRLVLPSTFFVDLDALSGKLGLAAPPDFSVSGADYLASLDDFGFALTDGDFRHPADEARFADTHFACAVPERAFEDQATLQAALDAGLVSPRLAASLLMVDFPNPVFSQRRAALRAPHAPESAPSAAAYSQEMADRILAAADAAGEGSPEREFADRWGVGEDFADPFDALLTAYYQAVLDRLATREGFFDYVRLAESRRDRVRALPIGREFELLFARPRPDTDAGLLRMTEAGTVEEDN